MTPIFNQIQLKKPRHNVFDLSHDMKLSCEMGKLVPVLVMEVIPGDRISVANQSLIRLAPMLAPMMHRVDVYFHSFFVPNRICWKGWEKFIISNTTGNTPPAFPVVAVGNAASGGDWLESQLTDYFGIPAQPTSTSTFVNAIPYLAYQKIWSEYYRDQNLQDEFPYPDEDWQGLIDGDNTAYIGAITGTPAQVPAGFLNTFQSRAWEHDYFTSSLPFAQKGAPVQIPFGDFNDVPVWITPPGDEPADTSYDFANTTGFFSPSLEVSGMIANVGPSADIPAEKAPYAKTSELDGGSSTINDLRTAFAIQTFFEKAARGGTRYTEQILMHFGVHSSDARLQRPEFIGGSRSPIAVSEVLNMTGTSSAPQGYMAGHGVAVVGGHHGGYYCEEHGFIITLMSVMPKTAYQQGIAKMWLKTTDAYDYFFPSFAHLGEQEVLNKEIYADESDDLDGDTFGYLPRYAEYRNLPSRVAGSFRTDLDFWHMGRIFANRPALNSTFIESDPTTRIFAVLEGDHLWVQVVNVITANRPIPIFGSPSNI